MVAGSNGVALLWDGLSPVLFGAAGTVHPLQRDGVALLMELLSRVQEASMTEESLTIGARYLADDDHLTALTRDLRAGVVQGVAGIATSTSHWRPTPNSGPVSVSPPPPSFIEFCVTPGAPLKTEERLRVRDMFAGKRLHIVSGRMLEGVAADLEDMGFEGERVFFLLSERAKPISGLDERWSGLTKDTDITVCVTGTVGHAVSGKAAALAAKRGVQHFQVKRVRQIPEALKQFANGRGG